MTRLLPLFLVACASLPEVRPCEPHGAVIDPSFLSIGNDDFMLASMEYQGCEEFNFRLCGIGLDWLTEDGATLGVWHDQTLSGCSETIREDELLNLYPLRTRYEDEFDVESATMTLVIGSHELEYSFAAPE